MSDQLETRTTYGYTYKVTKNHLTWEEMDKLKHTYDRLGSEAAEKLQEIARSSSYTQRKTQMLGPQSAKVKEVLPEQDTYALLKDNYMADPVLQELWTQVHTVPEWVDWEQIRRGQEVFYRYAPSMLATFALKSLIGTTGTSYRPAETLVRTGGHSAKVVRHRFFETFQLMLQVNQNLDHVKPGGNAFAAMIRVRLLHATVRNRILKLTATRATYFDLSKFGVPINDIDSMQSLCAFTTDLVYIGLPRQGVFLRGQEVLDLLAVWRYVGYVLGTPYHVLKTPEKARAVMESIMDFSRKATPNSRILVANALEALDGVSPIYASKSYWAAGGYWLNGSQVCEEIGIPRPPLYFTALIAGQCWLLWWIAYLSRVSSTFDRWKISKSRRVLWNYLVESDQGLGKESYYDFKYIPELGQRTVVESLGDNMRSYGGVETIALVGLLSALVMIPCMGAGFVGAAYMGYHGAYRLLDVVRSS